MVTFNRNASMYVNSSKPWCEGTYYAEQSKKRKKNCLHSTERTLNFTSTHTHHTIHNLRQSVSEWACTGSRIVRTRPAYKSLIKVWGSQKDSYAVIKGGVRRRHSRAPVCAFSFIVHSHRHVHNLLTCIKYGSHDIDFVWFVMLWYNSQSFGEVFSSSVIMGFIKLVLSWPIS